MNSTSLGRFASRSRQRDDLLSPVPPGAVINASPSMTVCLSSITPCEWAIEIASSSAVRQTCLIAPMFSALVLVRFVRPDTALIVIFPSSFFQMSVRMSALARVSRPAALNRAAISLARWDMPPRHSPIQDGTRSKSWMKPGPCRAPAIEVKPPKTFSAPKCLARISSLPRPF